MSEHKLPRRQKTVAEADLEAMYSKLPALAEAIADHLRNKPAGRLDADILREIIDEHEVVFGIYTDASEPRGFGVVVIKGREALSRGIDANTEVALKTTAVPCREEDEARAMRKVFGDDAHMQ